MQHNLTKCNFTIGQKVVCIMDNWNNISDRRILPKKNEIYTIRSMLYAEATENTPSGVYLLFHEIDNRHIITNENEEPRFIHICFKPLKKRKTDISVFKKLLNNINSEQPNDIST